MTPIKRAVTKSSIACSATMLLFIASPAFCAELDIFDQYPTRFAHVNDISLAYQDMGNPQAVPVILIMGLSMPLTYWGDPLVRNLLDHGYRVILFDNRDAGLSERFDHYGAASISEAIALLQSGKKILPPYTLADMAGDVVGLMDHLGIESAHLVGASMGGMIGQVVTASAPARVRSLVSMMSSSGAAHLPAGTEPEGERPPFTAPREDHIAFGMAMWKADGGNNSAVFDEDYARMRITKDYDRSHGWTGEGRQLLAVITSGDRVEMLKTITRPVLVLHGDIDPALPLAHGEHTASLIPASILVVVKDMGHSLEPALMPVVTAAIKEHIDGVEAAAKIRGSVSN